MENNQNVNLNIPMDVKPIFADEANVSVGLKVNIEKDDNGKETVTKVGQLNVIFFDNQTKSVVSRIVIDPITAKNLSFILKANADNLLTELKSDKIPKQVKEQIENTKKPVTRVMDGRYIG